MWGEVRKDVVRNVGGLERCDDVYAMSREVC